MAPNQRLSIPVAQAMTVRPRSLGVKSFLLDQESLAGIEIHQSAKSQPRLVGPHQPTGAEQEAAEFVALDERVFRVAAHCRAPFIDRFRSFRNNHGSSSKSCADQFAISNLFIVTLVAPMQQDGSEPPATIRS
jgi:hypothetical protein